MFYKVCPQHAACASAARTDGVIALAERSQQVGHGLQWTNHVFARGGDKHGKAGNDENRQRPLKLCAVVAKPEESESNNSCRGDCGQREPANSPFIGKAVWIFWFARH